MRAPYHNPRPPYKRALRPDGKGVGEGCLGGLHIMGGGMTEMGVKV